MSPGQQAAATLIVMVVAMLVFFGASHVGCRSVNHWLSEDERMALRCIRWPWWILTAITAVLISWATVSPISASRAIGIQWVGQCIFVGGFVGVLAALTRIDLASRLLPDPLTAGLMLSGLIFHWLFDTGLLVMGIVGAGLGYGLLWLLARLFELLRGQEAMGRGDFFMAAGLGAWLGWQALPTVLLVASLSALIAAIFAKLMRSALGAERGATEALHFLKQEIPFGPALAFGGLVTWMLHYG